MFPLAKGQRQRALDEGPLPFLFNMKAQEAEARYQMTLEGENAQYYVVKILPKLQEDKESFKVALLYLEKNFLLPARIALLSPDGKSSREFHLNNQKPNAEVNRTTSSQGGLYGLGGAEESGRRGPATGECRAAARRGGRGGPALRRPGSSRTG